MDLMDMMAVKTAQPIELEHPTTYEPVLDDKGKPATVSVWGPQSPPMNAVEKSISNDMLERASRSRGGRFKMDAASTERYARSRFMARIDGWAGLSMGGKPFTYNDANKTLVCDDNKFSLVKQMFEAAFTDDSAFLATNSSAKA